MSTTTNSTVSKALEDLVTKRQQQVAYLRRAHLPDLEPKSNSPQPRTYWLNTIQHSQQAINNYASDEKKLRAWFCLGLSLGKLIDQEGGPMLINSLIQLMEEFVFEFGGRAAAGYAYLRAKNLGEKSDMNDSEPIKPAIFKENNQVVFQFLDTPTLPPGIDYCLTVHALMSVLYLLYAKFLNSSCSHETWRKAIEVIDQKISAIILKPITDIMTNLTAEVVNSEINEVMPSSLGLQSSDTETKTSEA